MHIKDFSVLFNVPITELIRVLKESKNGVYSDYYQLSASEVEFLRRQLNLVDTSKIFKYGLSSNEKVIVQDMTVAELATRLKCAVTDLIVQFLKRGIVANKNQVVKKNQIIQLLRDFNISYEELRLNTDIALERVMEAKTTQGSEQRLPTVVVVGHVDHGKTTLLDFIRKSRVAEGEKGGITQQIAAYEVHTKHGNLVFVDTPGHEAFALMRERGVLLADLVVLIVALDDGIKPQTIECIKLIKNFGATVVVALNKIDRVSQDRIDVVKGQLSDQGLLPDDWGGQTPCIPVSAKSGQGVDELLDVIRLQADMLDLKTSSTERARGFVLESKMEHGRGAVATVILQQGTICRGHYFVCGSTFGKVSSIKNFAGKTLECAGPSIPALIAGFSTLAQPGDIFEFVNDSETIKKHQKQMIKPIASDTVKIGQEVQNQELHGGINVIVKASTLLSKEALLASITKLNQAQEEKIRVIDFGVGDINENNVDLAITTKSIVYGLGVKVNKTAQQYAKQGVVIKLYDIIYQLLEDAQEAVRNSRIKKIEEKITAMARVKAIFRIKTIGIVAGAGVEAGSLLQNAKVKILRNKEIIGKGIIKTLQKDRNKVSSVNEGSDCAFSVDGFSDWKEGDVVQQIVETLV